MKRIKRWFEQYNISFKLWLKYEHEVSFYESYINTKYQLLVSKEMLKLCIIDNKIESVYKPLIRLCENLGCNKHAWILKYYYIKR